MIRYELDIIPRQSRPLATGDLATVVGRAVTKAVMSPAYTYVIRRAVKDDQLHSITLRRVKGERGFVYEGRCSTQLTRHTDMLAEDVADVLVILENLGHPIHQEGST